jgi:hypothetical protein
MLDFRKVLLTLSVAAFGLVGTASAQLIQGSAVTVSGPGFAALETTTAALPTIQIPITSGTATGSVTIILTANVPFTNATVPSTTNLDVTATDGNGADAAAGITYTLIGPTQLQIVFHQITGTPAMITVSGLRVNASLAPANSLITISASGVAGGGFSDSGAATTVAFVVKSLAIPTITGSTNLSSCSVLATTATPVATAVIQEGFPTAFQTVTDGTAPGVNSIAPSQGTRLAVTFTNLNPGVNYYVPASINVGGTLTFLAYSGPTGTAVPTPVTSPASVSGQILLSSSGGTATAYYGVTAETAGIDSFSIPLVETIPSLSAVTSFSTSPVGISVTLVGPSTGYPEYSASQVAYTASQVTGPANGLLSACSTTLLFPYVLNIAGFDTGIALTNASVGTSAAGGSCNVTFYGTGAPAANPYNTGVISPGTASTTTPTVAPFDVGTVAPGFEGYAMAVCNFQGAHGYAFISDGLTTGTGVAVNYLAVVLADSVTAQAVTLTAQ